MQAYPRPFVSRIRTHINGGNDIRGRTELLRAARRPPQHQAERRQDAGAKLPVVFVVELTIPFANCNGAGT